MILKPILLLLTTFILLNEIKAQVPHNIPSYGLVGYWGFNGNANDESGNNNHGTVSNAILTTDRFGNPNKAYQFNGNSSRIDVNNAFFNISWQSFTISAWVNSNTQNNSNNFNNSQVIFNTDPHNGIAITGYGSTNPFSTSWNNKFVFLAGRPSTYSWDIVLYNGFSNGSRQINSWQHVTVVKNNTTYYIYLNGILDKTIVGQLTSPTYFCKAVFGNEAINIPNEGFSGKLDDFAIWNRALTNTEVGHIYNSSLCQNSEVYASPNEDIKGGYYLRKASNSSGLIQASNKILNSSKVIFQAKSTELNAGFRADLGTVFEVNSGTGCN